MIPKLKPEYAATALFGPGVNPNDKEIPINNNNSEDAIKTLEFIEKSLTDVESIIPQEFSSDMSKIDTSVISKEDMETVNELTAQMKTAKEIKQKEFKSDLIEINVTNLAGVPSIIYGLLALLSCHTRQHRSHHRRSQFLRPVSISLSMDCPNSR